MTKLIDDQVGRVFEVLEQRGLLDETMIIFMTATLLDIADLDPQEALSKPCHNFTGTSRPNRLC
jgi:membrane-anchored protein YejM (alkaline phosphatase superfamily)